MNVREALDNIYKEFEKSYEEARKEGYNEGFENGNISDDTFDEKIKEAYESGLNDAWEVVRKLIYGESEYEGAYSIKDINAIFGRLGYLQILKTYTATEAIEKIEKYEKKQKEANEIKVGDEVTDDEAWKGVVINISPDGKYLLVMLRNGTAIRWEKESFKKTGLHFPQIAEVLKQVLKQMQEGNE